jgi:dynein heavy chain
MFAKEIPILNKAVCGLNNLNKVDIDELRSLKHPPQALRTLLQAVCLIMRVEPKLVPIKGELNKYSKDYWTVAIGPKVLGDKHVMRTLGAIEPTKLDKHVMVDLEALMDSPEFSFILVDRCCVAG